MSTSKLVMMYLAWLLAAGAIALTGSVVTTELAASLGIVDRSGNSYGWSLNLLTGVFFVVLALVPFLYRSRFSPDDDHRPETT